MCNGNRDTIQQNLQRSSAKTTLPMSAPDLPLPKSQMVPQPEIPIQPSNPLKIPTPEGNPLKEPKPDMMLPIPKSITLPEAKKQTAMTDFKNEFVNRARPAAEKVAAALQVPVSAVLAQLAYESGWGKSQLASKYNNFGGLKAGSSWKGSIAELPTKEKNQTETEVAKFRAYDSPEEYATDMIAFLQKPRYKGVLGAKDPYQYALKLGLAGYHQDTPGVYASEIRNIAKQIEDMSI